MLTPTILFQSILFRGLLHAEGEALERARAASPPRNPRRAPANAARTRTRDRTGGRARERPRSTVRPPRHVPGDERDATRDSRRTLGGSPFASSGLSPDTDDTQHRARSIARIGPETGPASPRESPHTPDAARGHPYAPGMPTRLSTRKPYYLDYLVRRQIWSQWRCSRWTDSGSGLSLSLDPGLIAARLLCQDGW